MKGRGVRVINDNDLQSVTPDAKSKTHFVIVDAVGICEKDKTDSQPMERKKTVSLEKPPHHLRVDRLWNAYAALEKSKIRGASAQKILTDLISLIRFALHQEDKLEPFAEHVQKRYEEWLSKQKKFTEEQLHWLEMIKEHIIGSLSIEKEDFDSVPFKPEGGLGKAYQLFGEDLWSIMEELNEVLAA